MKIEQLKRVTQSTVDEINHLLKELSPENPKTIDVRSLRRKLKREGAYIAVAREGGAIIGMASIFLLDALSGCKMHVEDVVVDETHRGKRIAGALMNRLESIARRWHAKKIDLTSNDDKKDARRLYEALGYEKRETHNFRLKLPRDK